MNADVISGRGAYMLANARETLNKGFAIGLFIHLVIDGVLFHADFPLWRIGALLGGFIAFAALQRYTILSTPGPEHLDDRFTRLNVLAQTYMTMAATLTGGLSSPLVPMLALGAMLSVVYFGPYGRASALVLYLGVLIAVMAMMPDSVLGPPIPRDHYAVIVVLAMAQTLFAIKVFIGRITEATHAATCAIADLREDRLADAEAQARRFQSVGAKVAHELKNPLAAIKGLVQLVARAPGSAKTDERLAVVESEIDRMEAILREYLSFARPLEDLEKLPTDLAEIAAEVVSVLGGRLEQGRIEVELELAPAPMQADPRRLKEALINLLANAIDATPPGGRVRVATRPDADGAGGVVEIVDSGRGMAADVLERLGTSFFTTRPTGTGLGLVLALGVIAQHGGALHVASEPGRGTHVTITLPAGGQPAPDAKVTTSRKLPAGARAA